MSFIVPESKASRSTSPRCGSGSVSGPPRMLAWKKSFGLIFRVVEEPKATPLGEFGLPGRPPRGLEDRARVPPDRGLVARGLPGRGLLGLLPVRGLRGGTPAGKLLNGRGDVARGDACAERLATVAFRAAISRRCASISSSLMVACVAPAAGAHSFEIRAGGPTQKDAAKQQQQSGRAASIPKAQQAVLACCPCCASCVCPVSCNKLGPIRPAKAAAS